MTVIQPSAPTPVPAFVPNRPAAAIDTPSPRPADQIDLSSSAETPIRTDLINRVREQIQAGTYDESAKLDAAIPALLRDVTA